MIINDDDWSGPSWENPPFWPLTSTCLDTFAPLVSTIVSHGASTGLKCSWIKYYLCGGTLQSGASALKTSRKKTRDCFCRLFHERKQLATPARRQQHSDIDHRQTATHLYMKTTASCRWMRKFNSWTALWRNAGDYLFSPQAWRDGMGHALERFTWKTSWWRRLAATVMNYLQHQQICPLPWEYSTHPELHHIIIT